MGEKQGLAGLNSARKRWQSDAAILFGVVIAPYVCLHGCRGRRPLLGALRRLTV